MRASDFDFTLPEDLIAQEPLPQRDQSRLLRLDRAQGTYSHSSMLDLPGFLRKNDLLVLNDSKVLQARLRAQNTRTAGRFELLLVEENRTNDWWAMIKPGKRARIGTQLRLLDHSAHPTDLVAQVIDTNSEGHRRLRISANGDVRQMLECLGEVPLPPYIRRPPTDADSARYQTVYASVPGSIAAPTAGLHFTSGLLQQLKARGVQICHVTLHVGLGTFAPVKTDRLESHVMHEEHYAISGSVAAMINTAKERGHRIVAVGTTALRTLETAWRRDGIQPGTGQTRLFVRPPFEFQAVDVLLTNFHLPRSTLLMLVSAFADPGGLAGIATIRRAYEEAVRERYRFFSYGDAMLIQ